MVEFTVKDRVAEIRKIIAEQKSDEEELKKLEEELRQKKEELEKKKENTEDKKKKIDEILEDALEEESKDFRQSEKAFRRTDIQLQPIQRREETISKSEDKNEAREEIIHENKQETPQVVYRRTMQVPNVEDMYQQLETLYRSIPQQGARSTAVQQQRQVYHELKAMADKWSANPGEVERRGNVTSDYGQEITQNPDSESSAWARLSEKVKAMAELAGNDEFNYQARTETVLNQLRHRVEDREYTINENKKDTHEIK